MGNYYNFGLKFKTVITNYNFNYLKKKIQNRNYQLLFYDVDIRMISHNGLRIILKIQLLYEIFVLILK